MHSEAAHYRDVARRFQIPGEVTNLVPYGSGHINDTFLVDTDLGGRSAYFILQRINDAVFTKPDLVMENVVRVTTWLQEVLRAEQAEDLGRRCLTLVPAKNGDWSWLDEEGSTWRMYVFIARTCTVDVVEHPEQAWHAARSFGELQRRLADLPATDLHETIPDFHHTRRRFQALVHALERDPKNRAAQAQEEIDFVLRREADCDVLLNLAERGEVPLRVIHNDTKINNVLMDEQTGEGICVIDLDTVMPGLSLYDFGDLVRGATATCSEDERDLDKMEMDPTLFRAAAAGFLAGAGDALTAAERDHLAFSGRLLSLECGIRFLTDYLLGDRYFKTRRLDQNLDRSRSQFKLVRSIERQEDDMRGCVEELAGSDALEPDW